jgi:hypothetical protein
MRDSLKQFIENVRLVAASGGMLSLAAGVGGWLSFAACGADRMTVFAVRIPA